MGGRVDQAPSGPSGLDERDLAADAARVGALVFVVCAHIMLVTLITDPHTGAVANVMVPTTYPWFWWATWILQIMPLFFVVGGFASAVSLGRAAGQARNDVGAHSRQLSANHAGVWVRARLLRLAQPAAALWVVFAVATVTALALRVPAGYLDAALSGIGMHLWFLGAYALCLAAAPWTLRAHRHRPYKTLAGLVAAGLVVDLVRIVMGDPWWGLLGIGPIWMAIHQLGYFRADGSFGRARTGVLIVRASGGYVVLALITGTGLWSSDMLINLNPPTITLVLLGLSQACLLQLLTGPLDRIMRVPTVRAIAWVIGSRPVTLYLWHLPVIVGVMAVWWALDGPAPDPDALAWWLWRVPLAVLCWTCTLVLVRPLGVFERTAVVPELTRLRLLESPTGGAAGLVVVVLLLVTPAVLEIRYLLTPWLVVTGAVAYALAVVVLRGMPPRWRTGRKLR